MLRQEKARCEARLFDLSGGSAKASYRMLRKSRLLTRPTPAATSPARP